MAVLSSLPGSLPPSLLLTLFFMMSALLPQGALMAGGLGAKEARVTISVTDFDKNPVEGAKVTLERIGEAGAFEGVSDKKGEYVVVLPQGARFDVNCAHGGNTFNFGPKEIPSVGGPLNFALNLRIKASASGMQGGTAPGRSPLARTVVNVVNSQDQPEPDAVITFRSTEGGESFKGRTDSFGAFRLSLPRGATFEILCDKYGVTFDLGPHPIPDVDSFILNLKLILERSAFAQAGAVASPGGAEAETKTALVTITVVDARDNPESEAALQLQAASGGALIAARTDSSGRHILILPQGETYTLSIEKNGITKEAGDYLIPAQDTFEIPLKLDLASAYLETYRLENVYFDTARATLRPESYAPLNELAEVLKSNPTMVIELAGHTDSRGEEIYNLNLSRGRANAARDYILGQGIAPERLSAKGYGEFEPVAPNNTDEGMQLNRRTEVRVIRR